MRRQVQSHQKIKESILKNIQVQDYMHLAYLRPIQLVLKEGEVKDGKKQLPRGLKFINRNASGQNQDNHLSQDFDVDLLLNLKNPRQATSQIRQNMQQDYLDNLLIHMMAYQGIQICICICMYNQDKDMLDNTLSGVGQNIFNLQQQYNVNPDKVAVIILADGMGKISPTIIDWSQMMLKQSGMFLSDDIPEQTLQQMKEQYDNTHKFQNNDDDFNQQMRNYNSVLFNPLELQERKRQRFSAKKKQYDEVNKLLKEVTAMLQEKITPPYQRLPQRAKSFFVTEIKKYFKTQNGQDYDQKKGKIEDYAKKNYINQIPNMIRNALTNTKIYCNKYISSRDPITHVSFYRTRKYFPTFKQQQNQNQNQLNEENENSSKMNIFFCAKYKNAQKLSSHNWFFNGFCRQLKPKYSILLDVGLRPEQKALCRMYTALSNDDQLGGVCGYMGLKIQKADPVQTDIVTSFMHYFVDIQRAQQMEYHFAHLIDKPFQSWFNFIHVLPGAFSGYNMKAIWDGRDQKLLTSYFKSINDKVNQSSFDNDSDYGVVQVLLKTFLPHAITDYCYKINQDSLQYLMYQQNVYLAEDRILCMGIHKNGYKLQYLPDAYASVDPMKTIPDLLGQRKRWINGSFFAFAKVKKTLSQNSCCSQLGLNFQTYYLSFMNWLGFVAPALFLFTVYIAMEAFRADVLVYFLSNLIAPDSQIYNCFVLTMNFIYVMLIGGLILYSINLTNKNQKVISFVYGVSTILGILSVIVFVVLTVDLIRGLSGSQSFLISNSHFTDSIPGGQSTIDLLRYIILGIIGLYAFPVIISVCFFCKASILFQVIIGVLSFVFYTPTYISILNIYALCRMDDLSWGTKGLQTAGSNKNQNAQDFWRAIKIIHVAKYVFWNVVVGGLLLHFGGDFIIRFWLTFAIMILIGLTMMIKVMFAVMYYIQYRCCSQTRVLKTSLPQSQSLYKKFLGVKHHYVKSIEQNINGLVNNFQKQDKNNKLNANLVLNSHVSRIYMEKKKLQGLKVKNQLRAELSKRIMSKHMNIQTNKEKSTFLGDKTREKFFNQVQSPQKKSQNQSTDRLITDNLFKNKEEQTKDPQQIKKKVATKKPLIQMKKK